MTRKLIRVDERPGTFGTIVGEVQIRRRKGKRIACLQIYRERNGKKGEPIRGIVAGIKISRIFRDRREAPVMWVETIPDEQRFKLGKSFKRVLHGPIHFLPG